MNSHALGIDNGVFSTRKLFWLMVFFEVLTMIFVLYGDKTVIAYYSVIVLMPLILLLIPIEPVIGVPLILIATGFDFFAQITKSEERLFNLTYFHIIMIVTFISLFLNYFLKRKTTFPSISFWVPIIAFLAMIAFSLIYTPNFLLGFMEFVRLLVLCALTFTVILIIDSKWKINFVIWSFVLIPLGVSIFTIYEILTEGSFFASHVVNVASELGLKVYRSTGTFHNPNDLACFLMIGITLSFCLLFVKKLNPLIKVFLFVCICVTSIALITSFSRGGWLSTFMAVFVLVFLHRKWSYLGLFSGLFIIMLVVLSIKFPDITFSAFDRFASIFSPSGDESSSSRVSLIKTGIWMWQDHPIFGVGAGGFSHYAFDYIDPDMPRVLAWVHDPHTVQSKILAEEGLIGMTIAVWFFFTVLFEGIRSIKTIEDDSLKNIQIGLTALFVGFMVNFTFASDLHNNIFWITVGMIYAVSLVGKDISFIDNSESGESKMSLNNDSS